MVSTRAQQLKTGGGDGTVAPPNLRQKRMSRQSRRSVPSGHAVASPRVEQGNVDGPQVKRSASSMTRSLPRPRTSLLPTEIRSYKNRDSLYGSPTSRDGVEMAFEAICCLTPKHATARRPVSQRPFTHDEAAARSLRLSVSPYSRSTPRHEQTRRSVNELARACTAARTFRRDDDTDTLSGNQPSITQTQRLKLTTSDHSPPNEGSTPQHCDDSGFHDALEHDSAQSVISFPERKPPRRNTVGRVLRGAEILSSAGLTDRERYSYCGESAEHFPEIDVDSLRFAQQLEPGELLPELDCSLPKTQAMTQEHDPFAADPQHCQTHLMCRKCACQLMCYTCDRTTLEHMLSVTGAIQPKETTDPVVVNPPQTTTSSSQMLPPPLPPQIRDADGDRLVSLKDDTYDAAPHLRDAPGSPKTSKVNQRVLPRSIELNPLANFGRARSDGWSESQVMILIDKINLLGPKWAKIERQSDFLRTPIQMKDKWRNLLNKKRIGFRRTGQDAGTYYYRFNPDENPDEVATGLELPTAVSLSPLMKRSVPSQSAVIPQNKRPPPPNPPSKLAECDTSRFWNEDEIEILMEAVNVVNLEKWGAWTTIARTFDLQKDHKQIRLKLRGLMKSGKVKQVEGKWVYDPHGQRSTATDGSPRDQCESDACSDASALVKAPPP